MASLLVVAWVEGGRQRVVRAPDAVVTRENSKCVTCHRVKSPGIVGQWEISEHAASGIGCMECHEAVAGDADAYEHEGSLISTIVSPVDCAECHPQETAEFDASHHAKGGEILGSLDNVLAEVVEGFVRFDADGNRVQASAAAVSGCLQCHGSEVAVPGRRATGPGDMAEHRDRANQPGWLPGLLHGMPPPPRLLTGSGPCPRELRALPPWT